MKSNTGTGTSWPHADTVHTDAHMFWLRVLTCRFSRRTSYLLTQKPVPKSSHTHLQNDSHRDARTHIHSHTHSPVYPTASSAGWPLPLTLWGCRQTEACLDIWMLRDSIEGENSNRIVLWLHPEFTSGGFCLSFDVLYSYGWKNYSVMNQIFSVKQLIVGDEEPES